MATAGSPSTNHSKVKLSSPVFNWLNQPRNLSPPLFLSAHRSRSSWKLDVSMVNINGGPSAFVGSLLRRRSKPRRPSCQHLLSRIRRLRRLLELESQFRLNLQRHQRFRAIRAAQSSPFTTICRNRNRWPRKPCSWKLPRRRRPPPRLFHPLFWIASVFVRSRRHLSHWRIVQLKPTRCPNLRCWLACSATTKFSPSSYLGILIWYTNGSSDRADPLRRIWLPRMVIFDTNRRFFWFLEDASSLVLHFHDIGWLRFGMWRSI